MSAKNYSYSEKPRVAGQLSLVWGLRISFADILLGNSGLNPVSSQFAHGKSSIFGTPGSPSQNL